MDGSFHLHETALGMLCRGFGGLSDDVYALYNSAVLVCLNSKNATLFVAVIAGENVNGVTFFYL
jgi:uncharacterized RDD family membrane protein YckC